MNNLADVSRALATEIDQGEHRLDSAGLRQRYGVSRLTGKTRAAIAASLVEAGLEVVGDYASDPLVVRKVDQRSGTVVAARVKPPWYWRRWVLALAGIVLLLIIIPSGNDDKKGEEKRFAATRSETAPSSSTPAEPVETFEDAVAAADDDDYGRAVAVAAALGDKDENRIRRKISRRLAVRVRRALASGDRGQARRLLREADDYPGTAQARAAGVQLRASTQRASQRRAQARVARQEAEQRRDAERAAAAQRRADRRAADKAAAAEEAAPPENSTGGGGGGQYAGMNCDEIGMSFQVEPGTDPEHDRDNDGVACESQ